MSLPPLPTRQKFPDPDKHVAKQELHKEIRRAIQDLHKRLRNRFPMESEEVLRYATFINPGNNFDESRLPCVAKKATSLKDNKASCLFHRLSWLIQLHWKWIQNNLPETEQQIQEILNYLKKLNYADAKIVGDDRAGYELQ